jgi:hypothetical protein
MSYVDLHFKTRVIIVKLTIYQNEEAMATYDCTDLKESSQQSIQLYVAMCNLTIMS